MIENFCAHTEYCTTVPPRSKPLWRSHPSCWPISITELGGRIGKECFGKQPREPLLRLSASMRSSSTAAICNSFLNIATANKPGRREQANHGPPSKFGSSPPCCVRGQVFFLFFFFFIASGYLRVTTTLAMYLFVPSSP